MALLLTFRLLDNIISLYSASSPPTKLFRGLVRLGGCQELWLRLQRPSATSCLGGGRAVTFRFQDQHGNLQFNSKTPEFILRAL